MNRPSAISTPVTTGSPSGPVSVRTSFGKTPPCTVRPLSATSRPMACPAPSSSWVLISQGAPSMTIGSAPSCCSPAAASRPSSPPPMVTALTTRPSFSVSAATSRLRNQTSSSVR